MSSIWSKLVNLAGNITGTLPVANGGTGLTSGTSGGVLGFTASGTLASSNALAVNGVVIGGGAGATPTSLTAGTNGQLLVGVTSGAPAFGSTVSAATTFSGGVVFNGGATNLNWYQEGTFTPTITCATNPGSITPTYSAQEGSYTRIGRVVYYTMYMSLSAFSLSTGSGQMRFAGLPFAANASPADPGWGAAVNITGYQTTSSTVTALDALVVPGQSYIVIAQQVLSSVSAASTLTPTATITGVSAGGAFSVSITGWYSV